MVKNNWSLAVGDVRRRTSFRDMNEICFRVEEDHVWVSEFNLVIQEKDIERLQYD